MQKKKALIFDMLVMFLLGFTFYQTLRIVEFLM
jgi:hypothetical protein